MTVQADDPTVVAVARLLVLCWFRRLWIVSRAARSIDMATNSQHKKSSIRDLGAISLLSG